MPRAFDESEKSAIRATLMAKGLAHFERHGIRQARVEDICRDAGIAKGSFYSFFPSKEELFMTIVEEREVRHMADMYAYLDNPKGTERRRAGGFFDLILNKLETDPVLNIVLASGEIPHLILKLGRERFEPGQQKDQAFAVSAAKRWKAAGGRPIRPADLLGLMTITLSVATQRPLMTPEQYAPTVALLRELFVARLLGEAK